MKKPVVKRAAVRLATTVGYSVGGSVGGLNGGPSIPNLSIVQRDGANILDRPGAYIVSRV